MLPPVQRITSRLNPLVARYRAAARGELPGLVLLDGAHLIGEAITARVRVEHAMVTAAGVGQHNLGELVERLASEGVDVAVATSPVMDAVSPVRSPSGIVALAARPSAEQRRIYNGANSLVVIAIDIQDPGNLGAILRVAEAGGASGVIVAGASADPFGWKALRGSMGSALRLPVLERDSADEAIAEARRHGCRIVATSPREGQLLFDVDLRQPAAVLIGSEGAGLNPALISAADDRVTIPMETPVESLNAAVTAALIVYEAKRQRRA